MRALRIMTILCFYLMTGCSVNILSEFGDKTTDKALLFDAQMMIDDSDWDGAIAKFADMSVSFRAGRDVRALEASAYAGRCGLRFLDMIDTLASLGSTKLFLQLMTDFPGSNAQDVADCKQAETLLKSIDPDANNRTIDENLLMAFATFSKIGAVLSTYADANADGNPDWADDDSCSSANISDANVDEIGTGFANAIASLSAVAAATPIGSGQLSVFTTLCSSITGTLGASFNFCNALNTTDVTADMRRALRSIAQENQYVGIGSCNDVLVNCVCP